MKKTRTWVHTQRTWSKQGQEDIVVEGMHEKGTINWNSSNNMMNMTMNGWSLKNEKTWETEQVYYLPKITGKFA